jgi:hypothetical protein
MRIVKGGASRNCERGLAGIDPTAHSTASTIKGSDSDRATIQAIMVSMMARARQTPRRR